MKLAKLCPAPSPVAVPLIPMINLAFLLLIFFLMNLQVERPEAWNQYLPAGAPSSHLSDSLTPLQVGLRSDAAGQLTQLTLGQKNLGNDEAAFDRLSDEILNIVQRSGNPLAKDIEVEIDADYEVQYKYVIQAVSRCTGRIDPQTKQMIRYIEKVKFTPPHAPKKKA